MLHISHLMRICGVTHDTWVLGYAYCTARVKRVFTFAFWLLQWQLKSCYVHHVKRVFLTRKSTEISQAKSLEITWPLTTSALLGIPVNQSGQHSAHIWFMCLTQVVTLENASINLAAFKRSSRSVMEQTVRSLTRRKETTGWHLTPSGNASDLTLSRRGLGLLQVNYTKSYGKCCSIGGRAEGKVNNCSVFKAVVSCILYGTCSNFKNYLHL